MPIDNYHHMLLKPATLDELANLDDSYIGEPKFDGYRYFAESNPHSDPPSVTFRSRHGKMPGIDRPQVVEMLPVAFPDNQVVVDAELVAFAPRRSRVEPPELGEPQADVRQFRGELRKKLARAALIVFDVVEVDGQPVINESFSERRQRIEEMFQRGVAHNIIQIAPQFAMSDLVPNFQALHEDGYEGIVAKKLGGRYHSASPHARFAKRRTIDQLKYKFPDYPADGHAV